jgi:histidine triad (HIT) family protein
MYDPHCIFCKIIQGQIPSATVIETSQAVAFLDIHPVNRGHTLDLPEEIAAHLGSLLPRLCRAVSSATGAIGLNIVMNNGRIAGQTIDHAHWHIIPRFKDDPVNWAWPQGEYLGDELSQMRSRIERELHTC